MYELIEKVGDSLMISSIAIQMVSETQVILTGSFSALNERKDIIKTCGGFWDSEVKGFRCPMTNYYSLKTMLEKAGVKVQGIPDLATKALCPISQKISFSDYKKITMYILFSLTSNMHIFQKKLQEILPHKIYKNLYDFQKEGIEFGLRNKGRILIADEMGVGKTIQAICLASCFMSAWPLLILCPSSLKYNWKEEVLKWGPSLIESQVQILVKRDDLLYLTTKVLISSYDMAPNASNKFKNFEPNIAIVDEAHYLKNSQTKRVKSVLPFLQKLKHVILLTGTPVFARPKEVFTLLSIIRPDIFNSFKHFGDRYCDPKPSKYGSGEDYSGSSNDKELHFILKKTIMIRRLKSEVLTQLPQKRIKKIIVNTDPKIMAVLHSVLNRTNKSSLESLYNATKGQLESQPDDDGQKRSSSPMIAAFSNCYKLSGLAKLGELKNYIQDLLENDIKLIVFAHHKEMLNNLEEFVNIDQKKKSIRIDGSVNSKDRFERVQMFQNDPTVRVAILSLAAASTGLTLTASSNIIFAEMHWTPAIMQQAEDRAHRIGQVNSVICHYIVGERTLDDLLYMKIEQKIAVVSKILDGQQKKLRMNEIRNAQGETIHNDQQQELSLPDDIENIEVQNNNEFLGIKNNSQNNQIQLDLNYHDNFQSEHPHCIEDAQLSNINTQRDIRSTLNIINELQSSDSTSDDEEEISILKIIAKQGLIKRNNIQYRDINSFIPDSKIDEDPSQKNFIQTSFLSFKQFDALSFIDTTDYHLSKERNPSMKVLSQDSTQNDSINSLKEVSIVGNIILNTNNSKNQLYNNEKFMNIVDNKNECLIPIKNNNNSTNFIEPIKNESTNSQPYSINFEQNNLTHHSLNINTILNESTKITNDTINPQINFNSYNSFNLPLDKNQLILPRSEQNSSYFNDNSLCDDNNHNELFQTRKSPILSYSKANKESHIVLLENQNVHIIDGHLNFKKFEDKQCSFIQKDDDTKEIYHHISKPSRVSTGFDFLDEVIDNSSDNDYKEEYPIQNTLQNQAMPQGLQSNTLLNTINMNNSQDIQAEIEERNDSCSPSSIKVICKSRKTIEQQQNGMFKITFKNGDIIFLSDCDQDNLSDEECSESNISIPLAPNQLQSANKSSNYFDSSSSKLVSTKRRDFIEDESELLYTKKESSLKRIKKN